MIRNHCYCIFGITTIYFSLLIHILGSPTLPLCPQDQREALLELKDEFQIGELDTNPLNVRA